MVAPHPYPDTNGFHDTPPPPPPSHKKVHGIYYSPTNPWMILIIGFSDLAEVLRKWNLSIEQRIHMNN